ncbi:MAG: hypothetical protein JWL86_4457 [Rhizobium sp.]|nr:hypothetical protein [Rhizobium sp.]
MRVSVRLFAAGCIVISMSSIADASSRKEAYNVTVMHLVKASLCAVAEGNDATYKRAIKISKSRLIRAGYSKRKADAAVSALVRNLNAKRPVAVPYVRKICVNEVRALERQ